MAWGGGVFDLGIATAWSRVPVNPASSKSSAAGSAFVAHTALNAVELTVVDPAGRGFRTWIGAAVAPSAALRFCAATVRLVEGDERRQPDRWGASLIDRRPLYGAPNGAHELNGKLGLGVNCFTSGSRQALVPLRQVIEIGVGSCSAAACARPLDVAHS